MLRLSGDTATPNSDGNPRIFSGADLLKRSSGEGSRGKPHRLPGVNSATHTALDFLAAPAGPENDIFGMKLRGVSHQLQIESADYDQISELVSRPAHRGRQCIGPDRAIISP